MSDDRTFVSYSRADSPFAVKLASDLRANGASVWLDQLDIAPGARWDNAIEDALRRSARVIVVLSPTSVGSQNVLDEVSFALDEGKTIVPVLVEACAIPMRLRRLQYVDFTPGYDTALGRLLVTLGVARTSVSRAAPPAPEPPPVEPPPPAAPAPVPSAAYEPSFASTRIESNEGARRMMWLGGAGVAAVVLIAVFAYSGRGGTSPAPSDPPANPTADAPAPAPASNTSSEATAPAPTPTAPAPSAPARDTPASQRPMGTAEAAVANQSRLAPAGQLGGGGFGLAPLKKAGDMQALTTLVGQLSDRSSLTDADLRGLSEARLYACEVITEACFAQADGSVSKLLTAVCRRQVAAPDVSSCVNNYEETMTRLQQEKTSELLKRIKPG
jgi:hypothetical protein